MKHILYILALITFLFAAVGATQKFQTGNGTVEFQQYESYFEKNNDGLKGQTSYLVFTNQKQFDKLFGSAATMGQNTFLPADVFKSRIVVAAIKRGNLRTYSDVKVTSENGNLLVWYSAKDSAPSGATYKSPLILSVDKGAYKEIIFMENGKKVGTAKLSS